jgi:hypothetical protein
MANQQPVFTAYVVTPRGEGKDDFWTAIGSAFAHADNDGYNLILSALPVGNKIVLRPVKSADESHQGSGEQQNTETRQRQSTTRQRRS